MADDPTSCPECHHRNAEHVAGKIACPLPGCTCSVATTK